MRYSPILLLILICSACSAGPRPAANMPSGAAAYALMPAAGPGKGAALADYRIGPLDALDITVFGEPDLSVKAIPVDAAGMIALPLVGSVQAKGKTASELSAELVGILSERYLRDPQVTVSIASSVSQKVSIQGEVTEPGVYQLTGPTILLDVISLAKGETDVATLKQVVVFRKINGERMGAVFDVASIRNGLAADPVIEGNDLVVVGYSAARRFWHNVINAAPVFNIFRPVL